MMMGVRRVVFLVALICTATLAEAGLFSSEEDSDESSLSRQSRTTCTSTFDCRSNERCNFATNTCQRLSSVFDSSEEEDFHRTAKTMVMVPVIVGLVIFFLIVLGIGITIYVLMRRRRQLHQTVMATNAQQTWVVSTQQQQQPGYMPPGTYPPQGAYQAQPPAYPPAYSAAAGAAPYPTGTVPYPAPPSPGFIPSEHQRLYSPETNKSSNQQGLPPPYDNYRAQPGLQ